MPAPFERCHTLSCPSPGLAGGRRRELQMRAGIGVFVIGLSLIAPLSAGAQETAPPADRIEDRADRREDRRDRREDVRDHREDVKDRREDRRDRLHDGGVRDRREDVRDRRR